MCLSYNQALKAHKAADDAYHGSLACLFPKTNVILLPMQALGQGNLTQEAERAEAEEAEAAERKDGRACEQEGTSAPEGSGGNGRGCNEGKEQGGGGVEAGAADSAGTPGAGSAREVAEAVADKTPS